MNKNEYRRTLIMLRPRQSGYAGHARLERRVMMGSLYFIVTAPEGGALTAALVGQRGGEYFAAPLGALRRDGRGQATLAWSFDPRNVDGRPLDAYTLVAVADTGDGGCRLVLAGNVEGARSMDMDKAEAAVCAALAASPEPAADLPARDEAPPAREATRAEAPKEEAPAAPVPQAQPAQTAKPAEDAEVRIYTAVRPRRAAAQAAEDRPAQDAGAPALADDAAAETPEAKAGNPGAGAPDDAEQERAIMMETSPAREEAPGIVVLEGAEQETAMAVAGSQEDGSGIVVLEGAEQEAMTAVADSQEDGSGIVVLEGAEQETMTAAAFAADGAEIPAGATASPDQPAAQLLGLDTSLPWTGALEPLRALFAERAAVPTLEDDYVYVAAPLDGEEDALRVGLHVSGGVVDGLRYAVPALYTPDPPEGLEAWSWVGDDTHGWWVTTADPQA